MDGIPGPNLNAIRRRKAIELKTVTTSIPPLNTVTPSTKTSLPSSSGSLGDASTIKDAIGMVEAKLDTFPKFTLFPKFPLELPCQIWKESFRGRHVGVTVGSIRGKAKRYRVGGPQGPPFTLRICRDSRAETMRRYVFIRPMSIPKDMVLPSAAMQVIHPFHFNSQVDTLYTESAFFYHYPIRGAFNHWFKNIMELNPSVLRNAVTLEIREVDYQKLETYGRFPNKFNNLNRPLTMFPNLKIVRYTSMDIETDLLKVGGRWLVMSGIGLVMGELGSHEARDKYEKQVDSWLVRNEKLFTSGKAPVVSVRWILLLSKESLPSWTLHHEDYSRR
ncbi:hypothetical protein IFR05_003741 [Cadophora sp. M221]|nr:hypothetical protein IFR05_003741 [Cadophora sp. M221]